ncbi:MAG TPA: DUF3168 domain-containing protein [Tahibacter sp.]|nr:DUF3168 domain-containing protein [Tahibacter sp.]
MNPPVLALVGASGAVTDIIGTAPVRCFAFGVVPAPPVGEPADFHLPCLTYKTLTSRPEHTLGAAPSAERLRVRVEAWAADADTAMTLFDAARAALEDGGKNVLVWGNKQKYDAATQRYRVRGKFDFWVDR